jgi:hypothetical protein
MVKGCDLGMMFRSKPHGDVLFGCNTCEIWRRIVRTVRNVSAHPPTRLRWLGVPAHVDGTAPDLCSSPSEGCTARDAVINDSDSLIGAAVQVATWRADPFLRSASDLPVTVLAYMRAVKDGDTRGVYSRPIAGVQRSCPGTAPRGHAAGPDCQGGKRPQ